MLVDSTHHLHQRILLSHIILIDGHNVAPDYQRELSRELRPDLAEEVLGVASNIENLAIEDEFVSFSRLSPQPHSIAPASLFYLIRQLVHFIGGFAFMYEGRLELLA